MMSFSGPVSRKFCLPGCLLGHRFRYNRAVQFRNAFIFPFVFVDLSKVHHESYDLQNMGCLNSAFVMNLWLPVFSKLTVFEFSVHLVHFDNAPAQNPRGTKSLFRTPFLLSI